MESVDSLIAQFRRFESAASKSKTSTPPDGAASSDVDTDEIEYLVELVQQYEHLYDHTKALFDVGASGGAAAKEAMAREEMQREQEGNTSFQ